MKNTWRDYLEFALIIGGAIVGLLGATCGVIFGILVYSITKAAPYIIGGIALALTLRWLGVI
jgi:hypothetical protein